MPGEKRTRQLIGETFIVTHLVDNSHDGWRADNFLCTHYKHFSRNKIQRLIDESRITIKGKRLKASTTLRSGDQIQVLSPRGEEPAVILDYGILYEDEYVLVIDKPANLPVHPAGKFLFNTLLMDLRQKRKDWIDKGHDFHLIHRLDRETSGVLLLAKTSEMAGLLVKQFRERTTLKKYVALVEGVLPKEQFPEEFEIDLDIGSDTNSEIRLKMSAFEKGKGEWDALTICRILKRTQTKTLIECELKTGRQHQIRVHLSAIGFPVVGDKLYGKTDQIFLNFIHDRNSENLDLEALGHFRQALHSKYLKFFHNKIGKMLEIESPIPLDMVELLKE